MKSFFLVIAALVGACAENALAPTTGVSAGELREQDLVGHAYCSGTNAGLFFRDEFYSWGIATSSTYTESGYLSYSVGSRWVIDPQNGRYHIRRGGGRAGSNSSGSSRPEISSDKKYLILDSDVFQRCDDKSDIRPAGDAISLIQAMYPGLKLSPISVDDFTFSGKHWCGKTRHGRFLRIYFGERGEGEFISFNTSDIQVRQVSLKWSVDRTGFINVGNDVFVLLVSADRQVMIFRGDRLIPCDNGPTQQPLDEG